tara:strand:- start:3176 stop:3310 length:135 start_codon:yes stop_codon:yes gene_type:complete
MKKIPDDKPLTRAEKLLLKTMVQRKEKKIMSQVEDILNSKENNN